MGWKKFVDWVNLVLGIWLIVAPAVIGGFVPAATWCSVILGILVAVFSIAALRTMRTHSPEWINAALGILLFISPWVLKFSSMHRMARNDWIVGVVVAILALVSLGVHLPGQHTAQPSQPSHQ